MLGGFVLDLTRAEDEGDDAVLYVNTILGGGERRSAGDLAGRDAWLGDPGRV